MVFLLHYLGVFFPALPTSHASSGKKRKSTESLESRSKRARVSFGPKLSPEHFLKTLPPSTPVRKGATPKRMASNSDLKPLLKRKSVVTVPKSPIKEESPQKARSSQKSPKAGRSPRSPNDKKSPQQKTKSPSASPKTAQNKVPEMTTTTSRSPVQSRSLAKSATPTSSLKTPMNKLPKAKPSTPRSASPKTPSNKSQVIAVSPVATPAKPSPKSPTRSQSPKTKATPKSTPKKSSPTKAKSPVSKISPNSLKKDKSMDESFGLDGLFQTPNLVTSTPAAGSKKKRKSAVLNSTQSKKNIETKRRASTGNLGGVKRLLKTPKRLPDTSFTGIAALMKTPTAVSAKKTTPKIVSMKTPADISYTGIATMMKTPKTASSKKTPTMKTPKTASAKKTPKVKSAKPSADTSYSGIADMMATPKQKLTPTRKNSPKVVVSPAVQKINNPIADLRKAVAIRAIHGKSATPKLLKMAPASWADVVKKGVAKKVLTPQAKRVMHGKRAAQSAKKNRRKVCRIFSKKFINNIEIIYLKNYDNVVKYICTMNIHTNVFQSIAKTPRTIARAAAPTTGHADSPMTLVIGKKKAKTPRALPKKGRKSVVKSKVQGFKLVLNSIVELFEYLGFFS